MSLKASNDVNSPAKKRVRRHSRLRRPRMQAIPRYCFLCGALLASLTCAQVKAQTTPITLQVDAREAPRRIFHAQLTIPATPGPLTLLYPKKGGDSLRVSSRVFQRVL